MRCHTEVLLLALILATLPPASAQSEARYQLTPYAGYRMGGLLRQSTDEGSTDLDVREGAAFGLIFDVAVTDEAEFEVLVSRQETRLEPKGFLAPESPSGIDITIDNLQLGGLYLFDDPATPARAFFGITLGVTRFDPGSGYSGATRFAAGLSGGVRWMLSRRIGLRAQLRYTPTFFDSSGSIFCAGSGGASCSVTTTSDVFSQFELGAGVAVAF